MNGEPIPPRTEESGRVAGAIRAAMGTYDIDRTELRDRIEKITGTRPSEMWLTRVLTGQVHLTERVMVSTTEPADNLRLIARAIDEKNANVVAAELGRAAAEVS